MMNLETAFDLSSEMYCVLDKQHKITTLNKSFANVLKVSKEDSINLDLKEFIVDDDKNSFTNDLQNLEESKTKLLKFNIENRLQNNIHLRARVVKKDNYYYLIANQVILQDAPLARFRRFFDMSLLDILVIADKDRKIVYSNKNFPKMLGYQWEEVQNMPFENLICKSQREDIISFLTEMKLNQDIAKAKTSKCIHKANGDKWISWRMIYARSNFYIVGYDVTERKRQEIEIQKLLSGTMKLNEDLGVQNAELMQSRAELQQTLSELETRNFELDQFVYKVSHDLRAPLTSILGLVNLAILELENTERIEEYFRMIEKSTQKLDTFVQSLLNYSRSNRLETKIEVIDFEEMIEDSFDNLKFLENFDKIEKNIHIDSSQKVYSESIRLKIIFNNIISNAIKYQNPHQSNQNLKIYIQHLDDNQVKIIFEDNGIGIAQEYQKDVFGMFFRATENSQGSGLGLYIVKQTIEKLNGDIKLESEYGEFTRFTFIIPNHIENKKTDQIN